METWLSVWLATTLIGVALARLRIYIVLNYHRRKADDTLTVEVHLLRRLLTYHLEVPLIQLSERGGLLWLESHLKTGREKTVTHTDAEQRFTAHTWDIFLHDPSHWKYLICQFDYYTKLYNHFMRRVLAALVCEKLSWETRFGADDAATTSLMTGFLWYLKSQTYSLMKRRLKYVPRPSLNVTPLYTWVGLEVDFQCIFSIRLGNVINAAAGAIRQSRKGDGRQWTNIRSRV
jgi:hypothetical protein